MGALRCEDEDRLLDFVVKRVRVLFASLVVEIPKPINQRFDRRFESFSNQWYRRNTRFHCMEHCKKAFLGLNFPLEIDGVHNSGTFILDNRCRVNCQEAFLVVLYKCTYPRRLEDITEVFGRDYSHWSRVIKFTLNWVLDRWSYLILSNFDYWVPMFPLFNAKVNEKILSLGFPPDDMPLLGRDQHGEHNVAMIIDCCIIQINNVGTGPATRGINAHRKDKLFQRAYFTGWKKLSGVKIQVIGFINGMDAVYGPVSCRRSDNYLRKASRIIEELEFLQESSEKKYCAYGDSAYQRGTYMYTGGSGPNPTNRQKNEDACFCAVREPIEWGNKDLKNYFKGMEFSGTLRLLNMAVFEMILFSILMKNILCTFYGNQTSDYFKCKAPTFEEYTGRGAKYFNWREAGEQPPEEEVNEEEV